MPDQSPGLDALVRAAKAGDPAATEALVLGPSRLRRVVDSIKRDCDPRRRERDEAEAAARLGILEALNGFDPDRGTDFVSYAYRFVKGRVLRALYVTVYRRADDERPKATLVSLDQLLAESGAESDGYEAALLDRDADYGRDHGFDRLVVEERRADVRAFVRSLPDSHQTIVVETFWRGRTQDEIAADRGVSRQAVSKTLGKVVARGRRDLSVHFGVAA